MIEPSATRPLSMVAALVSGFIRPARRQAVADLAGRRRRGERALYATTSLVEELEAACWEDWGAVVERLALGAQAASTLRKEACGTRFRWRTRYLGDDGRLLPIVVTMPAPEDHGAILAMLDGE